MIFKDPGVRIFVHQLVVIEVARYRSPFLSVVFNRIIVEFPYKKSGFIEQQNTYAIFSEAQVKSHLLYKTLQAENKKP